MNKNGRISYENSRKNMHKAIVNSEHMYYNKAHGHRVVCFSL